MPEQTLTGPAVAELLHAFSGTLLQPGDDGFEEARLVWNGIHDRHPALIARCATPHDVVAALAFARGHDLTVAVRGGAHSAPGYATCDDGIVIDLSPMKKIQVDPVAKTVRAEAGLTWGEFDAATQVHGLAVTGGRFSTTGIAGLTLGSGSGWLERKCGLTADNLLSADIVTAAGERVTASADENADLFWGIRGGSGNFGIVTSFEYRLHDVGPIVYGGMLLAMPDRARETLAFFRDFMDEAPDDLGGGVAFINAPPAPFVPAELHHQPVVGAVICWTGSADEGERVVAPIRNVMKPVVDVVQPMPYTALQSMLDEGGPKGIRGYFKAEFLEDLTDDAIEKIVAHGAKRPGPLVQLLMEPMGGAISRVADDDTALGRRDVPWCYHALAMWMEPDDDTAQAHIGWARELADELKPHTVDGVYLNYISDEGEERVRSTYGPLKYDRLVALKDRYDPENLFRLNQNIRPSSNGRG